jgi:hypothetical protein
MFEIAYDLERNAASLRPIVLIGPGLAAVVVGLFLWLGGLGLRRLLAAIVGAVGGAICGYFLSGQNVAVAGIATVVGLALAVIFERAFMVVLAAALTIVFGFGVLAIVFRKADFAGDVELGAAQIPIYSWIIVAAAVVALIIAGVYLWRFTSALCCAALGTTLILLGLGLLLIYKGAMPVSVVSGKPVFYAGIFGAMTAFGTVVQLLLCPAPHKLPRAKKEKGTDEEKTKRRHRSWRT